MSTALRRAMYADIEALPEHVTGELIDGVLYTHARPAGPHVFAASGLRTAIDAPFGMGVNGPGGWIFASEPELHAGSDVLVPDMAAWRVARLPPAARRDKFFTIVPDCARGARAIALATATAAEAG